MQHPAGALMYVWQMSERWCFKIRPWNLCKFLKIPTVESCRRRGTETQRFWSPPAPRPPALLSSPLCLSVSFCLCVFLCLAQSRAPPSHCLSPLSVSPRVFISVFLCMSLSYLPPLSSPLLPFLSVYLCPLSLFLCLRLSLLSILPLP